MRFGTAVLDGCARAIVVTDDTVHAVPGDVTVEDLVASGLTTALEQGEAALSEPGVALADVRLLRPLRPASVRDFVTFEAHVEGVRRSIEKDATGVPEAWYDAPTFYFTNPHAIVGPDDDVPRPDRCRALDFELEVAAVVTGGGTSLTEAKARDAIFGYTLFNDWSARDLQGREMQTGLGPAKGKDFCSSLGPWILTADELATHRDADGFLTLSCTVSVNGTELGKDTLAHMGWTFETMLAYASRDSLVVPCDVLASGTTGGGGSLAERWGRTGEQLPPPLEPGDVVTISADLLGSLTNTVVAGPPTPPLKPFRPAPKGD